VPIVASSVTRGHDLVEQVIAALEVGELAGDGRAAFLRQALERLRVSDPAHARGVARWAIRARRVQITGAAAPQELAS